ncbi:hypothetical protein [Virgibacillus sp. Bac332]|uniref:hypothetical protein n=1 Tax=Virgibacillus sp. Bac332 TaxID=2419842 RepID=UPI000EF49DEE|nr:hypothetical protein [Virgibacillus sp. Bac332]
MKEIGIKRAIEEVSIDGTAYKIDLSDDKREKYVELTFRLQKVGKGMEKTSKIKDETVLKNALAELKDETRSITKELIGEGAFEEIYPKTNYSTEHTLDVVIDVLNYIRERQQEKYEEKMAEKEAKYLNKK